VALGKSRDDHLVSLACALEKALGIEAAVGAHDREKAFLEIVVAAGKAPHALFCGGTGCCRRLPCRLWPISAGESHDLVACPVLGRSLRPLEGALPIAIDPCFVIARAPAEDAPELKDDYHSQDKEHDGEDV